MQKALEVRDQFISLAAHELRTPLTGIHGYSQLLRKKFTPEHTPEFAWISELSVQTNRLIYLVNELLEVTRIRTNKQKYAKQPVDLGAIVENVIRRFQYLYRERHFLLENSLEEEKLKILGDTEKIDQLLSHLLDNAEKFSFENKPIKVSLLGIKKILF